MVLALKHYRILQHTLRDRNSSKVLESSLWYGGNCEAASLQVIAILTS